jgi:hypothetical protein
MLQNIKVIRSLTIIYFCNFAIYYIVQGSLVKCGSSGRGRILVGDSEGALHSISRQLETKTVAQAHLKGIQQVEQLRRSAYVVTLGVSE